MPIQGLDALLALPILPGIGPVESAIGKAWLRKHANDYHSVQLNVRLGSGAALPPGTPSYVQAAAFASTTKRADIIAYNGNNISIVEIKQTIGLGALGQLLGYSYLYVRDNPETGHIGLIAAAADIQADIAPILQHHQITVELFPNATIG